MLYRQGGLRNAAFRAHGTTKAKTHDILMHEHKWSAWPLPHFAKLAMCAALPSSAYSLFQKRWLIAAKESHTCRRIMLKVC